jgi:hypothetical protein
MAAVFGASVGLLLDRLRVFTILAGRIQGGIDQDMTVGEECQTGVREEIHIARTAVEDDECAFVLKNREQMNPLISKPQRLDAAAPFCEVLTRIRQGLEQTLGSEIAEGKQIDEHLSAPAETEPVHGTRMFKALDGCAEGRCDFSGHLVQASLERVSTIS